MTQKHFIALAALVASVKEQGGSIGYEKLANDLADICAESNERFDRTRFLAACGAVS